jgi:predicted PurR-regulated permease PerM
VTQPLNEPEPIAIRMPLDVRNLALTALTIMAAIVVLRFAGAMLIPIVLATLISYALTPLVTLLTRIRVPRALGSALVLLAFVAGGAALAYQLRHQFNAVVEELPQAARRLRIALQDGGVSTPRAIEQMQKAATELQKAADATATTPTPGDVQKVQIAEPAFDVTQYLMSGSMTMVGAAGSFIMVLFLAYFLLASGDLHRRKLVKIVGPSLSKKRITLQILEEIDRQIELFLLMQLSTSILVGIASWLAFHLLGLQQAALWGFSAGVLNSIPYFGPVIVTTSIGVVAFLQFGTIEQALVVAAVSLAITSLEGMLLTPWLTSRAGRMNAAAVFVGLLFWSWVWSIWGMLLAVPMLMVIKAICDHVEDFKGVGELLGD